MFEYVKSGTLTIKKNKHKHCDEDLDYVVNLTICDEQNNIGTFVITHDIMKFLIDFLDISISRFDTRLLMVTDDCFMDEMFIDYIKDMGKINISCEGDQILFDGLDIKQFVDQIYAHYKMKSFTHPLHT